MFITKYYGASSTETWSMRVYAGLFVTQISLTRNERLVFEFEVSDYNCLKYQQKIPLVVLVLRIELWWVASPSIRGIGYVGMARL